MKIITIQIGNSDNKLTQQEWSTFVYLTQTQINIYVDDIHFFGCPAGNSPWQNAAWVISIKDDRKEKLKEKLLEIRKLNRQDSIAWTEGDTEFI